MAVNQNFKESTVSTSNHTQNYDLPLWTEGDKTSWLTQVNDAMNKIDSGMVDAKSKALEVVGIAADAKKLAEETSAESKESAKIVAGYNDRLTAVEATSVEHTNDITALNTRCDQMDVEIHSVKETQKKTTEDLGTLADQVKHNKEDADATKQSVSVLNGNVVELTGRVTTCEDDIEALKVTTAANTKNIAQTEENVATITGKVTALETEVGEVSAATQSNTTAISAINASIESIKAKNTEQDGKIAAIEEVDTEQNGKISNLFTMYGLANDNIIELQEAIKVSELSGSVSYTFTEGTNVRVPYNASKRFDIIKLTLPALTANGYVKDFTMSETLKSIVIDTIELTGDIATTLELNTSYNIGAFIGAIYNSSNTFVHSCVLNATLVAIKPTASSIVAKLYLATPDLYDLAVGDKYNIQLQHSKVSFILEV